MVSGRSHPAAKSAMEEKVVANVLFFIMIISSRVSTRLSLLTWQSYAASGLCAMGCYPARGLPVTAPAAIFLSQTKFRSGSGFVKRLTG
jgi:hypothetical protein